MIEIIQSLYSSFSVSSATLLVVSALIAGTVAQLVRDGEVSWRKHYKTKKPALMAIYLRLIATLTGGLSGLSLYFGFLEIPPPIDPVTAQAMPYSGPTLLLAIFLGLFGGLFFTLVIAGVKGHLKKNPATKAIADSLPSFENITTVEITMPLKVSNTKENSEGRLEESVDPENKKADSNPEP